MTTLSRRQRIQRLAHLGFLAQDALRSFAEAEPTPLPPELAHRLLELTTAARDIVTIAEREVVFLEGARDWGDGA